MRCKSLKNQGKKIEKRLRRRQLSDTLLSATISIQNYFNRAYELV